MANSPIRLDQLLKVVSAVQSGGEAKMLIQSGEVTVNGEVETRRKRQLQPGDTVQLGDQSWTVDEDAG